MASCRTSGFGHCGAAADLLLVTSRREAVPIALLEAAVARVPAVGTAVGHLVEWSPYACHAVPVQRPQGNGERRCAPAPP